MSSGNGCEHPALPSFSLCCKLLSRLVTNGSDLCNQYLAWSTITGSSARDVPLRGSPAIFSTPGFHYGNAFPAGASIGAGSAAQRHSGAGLTVRHGSHHVTRVRVKCGGAVLSHPCASPEAQAHPSPYGQGAVSTADGGRAAPARLCHPWPLQLLWGGSRGPPELAVTPCCPWSPAVGRGCLQEALAQSRLENCTGAIPRLPARALEACRGSLLSYPLLY